MTSLSSIDATVVVSVDELRAVHRLAGLCLPRFVVADDAEDPRVDAAAVRGLVARELAVLDPGVSLDNGVLVTGPLAALLAPCRAARWIAEIDVEASGVFERHAVIAGAAGAAVVVTERAGGLVSLRLTAASLPDEVSRLSRVDEVDAPAPASPFTVRVEAHRDADELALSGAGATAVQVLTAAGVAEPAARAWITAVCGRRCAAAVTVARNCGAGPDGPFEVSEVRWLVAGDGTGWRVRADEPAEHNGDLSPDGALSVLTPVTGNELRAALGLVRAG
ncbi:MAG: hypothetical protein ACRDRZ_14110 [Pseudonocardiaceae bacterium]